MCTTQDWNYSTSFDLSVAHIFLVERSSNGLAGQHDHVSRRKMLIMEVCLDVQLDNADIGSLHEGMPFSN
jgi:hypothetical protein